MEKQINQAIINLQRNNMAAYVVENKAEVIALLKKLIPMKTSVGSGDSSTLESLGVFDFLREYDCDFLDKHIPTLTSAEKREIYLQNFRVDTFITGTNAVSEDGQLFNIDGNGSRVAPMLYGPDQVIVIVGINKLVKDVTEAIARARQIAAVQDAKRLQKETPCTTIDRCIDCHHKQRICNDFVLIHSQFIAERIKVIIVKESLGF